MVPEAATAAVVADAAALAVAAVLAVAAASPDTGPARVVRLGG